jgi:hypothetical protein
VIVAILALLGLTSIAYALGRLSGFIPGFGFTSQGGSVINEPRSARDEPRTPVDQLRDLLFRFTDHWDSYRVFD